MIPSLSPKYLRIKECPHHKALLCTLWKLSVTYHNDILAEASTQSATCKVRHSVTVSSCLSYLPSTFPFLSLGAPQIWDHYPHVVFSTPLSFHHLITEPTAKGQEDQGALFSILFSLSLSLLLLYPARYTSGCSNDSKASPLLT